MLLIRVNFQALVVILIFLFLMVLCLPRLVAVMLFLALMGAASATSESLTRKSSADGGRCITTAKRR